MLPAVVFIGRDYAILVDARAHLCQVRGAIVVPAQFVPAHVLHANWLARRRGHDGGGLCRVLVARTSERPRSLEILQADFRHGTAEYLGDLLS